MKQGRKVVDGEDYVGRLKDIDYNPDSLENYDLYVRVLSEKRTGMV